MIPTCKLSILANTSGRSIVPGVSIDDDPHADLEGCRLTAGPFSQDIHEAETWYFGSQNGTEQRKCILRKSSLNDGRAVN